MAVSDGRFQARRMHLLRRLRQPPASRRRWSGARYPAWPYKAVIGPTCLPNKGVECRVCGDFCDARAIRFAPRIGGSPLPEIDTEKCTGCGACVAPCPLEQQFTRKPLPLAADEERSFEIAHQLWARLGIAYLRVVSQCTPANRALPLHRAAGALRVAQSCHFLAARACPPLLDHLLLSILATAEVNGILRKPLADPDFPQHGKGSISGQLAWAFMMRSSDPYHLTALQLPVVNRVFSRWRELVNFHEDPPASRGSYTLDLSLLFANKLPEGVPPFLNLRSVAHKLAQRVKLLEAGESPESLKLGRSLSAAAAVRLLKDLEQHLHPRKQRVSNETGDIELVFGAEDAYAVLTNRVLNPAAGLGDPGQGLNLQRRAIFGLDQASQLPSGKKRLKVEGEQWTMVEGRATRVPKSGGGRHLSPSLVAAHVGGTPITRTR
jgi:ferredoxin